jgi:hypothetical protein
MILVGFTLVLLTWALALLVVVGMGLLPAALVSPGSSARVVLSRAMWWGLLVTAIASYAINLVQPLRSGSAVLMLISLAVLSTGAGLLVRRGRDGGNEKFTSHNAVSHVVIARGFKLSLLVLRIVLIACVVYLAFAALGPVTNYDTGLYHLGAIQYASEFPTIPGLASIFPPLGYGNAEFPLAALMGNGPLGTNGYRTLNGFVMLLLVVDVLLRVHARRFGAGFFVLVTGLTAAMVPMVALSDYWMTSPSQDSAVMLVTIAATTYFVDALTRRRSWVASGAPALALCILLVMLRPTMIVFAGMTLVVLALIAWKRRSLDGRESLGVPLVITGLLGICALVVATARDYVLSGWLQYPLSIHAFDVEWRSPDPVSERLATLGYHRNPDDIWGSINGWDWVPHWVSRVPTQWEFVEFLGLLMLGVLLLLLATRSRVRVNVQWRLMLLAILPSAIALCFWWVATPPSFRFIWGSLFMAPAILVGWVLARLQRSGPATSKGVSEGRITAVPAAVVMVMAIAMGLTVAYSSVARLDLSAETESHTFGPLNYAVTPPISPEVAKGITKGGVKILQPQQSEQCWAAFPLCTPRLLDTVAPRGSSIRDGFLP